MVHLHGKLRSPVSDLADFFFFNLILFQTTFAACQAAAACRAAAAWHWVSVTCQCSWRGFFFWGGGCIGFRGEDCEGSKHMLASFDTLWVKTARIPQDQHSLSGTAYWLRLITCYTWQLWSLCHSHNIWELSGNPFRFMNVKVDKNV